LKINPIPGPDLKNKLQISELEILFSHENLRARTDYSNCSNPRPGF
jgi:hypothetical protein